MARPLSEASARADTQEPHAVQEAVAALLGEYESFLFDCDGTLYHADRLLPHVDDAIRHLRSLGKKVFFVTNTSSRSSAQLQQKLAKLGIHCEAGECVPSGTFTASYVRRMHPDARRVYVIGGQGLVDELQKVGFECCGGPVEDAEVFKDSDFEALAESVGQVAYDGVVVGWDTALNYYKITKSALVFQRNPLCFFYATNADPADRVGRYLLPGNGSLLPAMEAACAACVPERRDKAMPYGARAMSLGKPNPEYARCIAQWNGIELSRAVFVGDRLDTDILMGIQAGMASCLVLTGVDGREHIAQKGIQPTYTLPEVGCLWTARPQPAARI